MNDTFYDGHDELYHRAKFGVDRTMRAGCRCENVVFITGRIAAQRQTAGIVFTHRPEIRFFAPQGLWATRCTDSGQTLQDRRAPGSAWLCKISPQSPQGVGMRPQKYQKFPFFW